MKFKGKRFWVLFFVCVLFTLAVMGCGENNMPLQIAPGQITGAMIKELKIKNMTELTSEQVELRYSLDMSVLEDKSVYISAQNNNADEVAVFELKDGEKVAPVMSAVNERIQQKLSSFENLNPTEYQKVKNAVAENIGPYVVVVICDNSDQAKEVFAEIT